MKLIIIFLLYSTQLFADCIKQIKVQEVIVKSNPNVFQKIINPKIKGIEKEIWINCDLYDQVKVGDELTEPGDPVDRIRLFSSDRGVLERKHYIVIKKY